jgi:hypothetical protein
MRLTLAACLAGFAVLAAGAGSSVAAAPNGIDAKTPTQILAAAKTAADNASTVHVDGTVHDTGGLISLNLRLVNSKVCVGRISTNGAGVSLVRVGDRLYLKADAEFLQQNGGSAAVGILAGRWFTVSTTVRDFKSLAPLTDLDLLVKTILGSHAKLELGAPTRIGGQPAIALVDSTDGGTLYIAASGEPYPLELKGPKGQGAIRFEGWNAAVTVSPPRNSLDFSKVPGG